MSKYTFSEFCRGLTKISKSALITALPLIISLFAGGLFLRLYIFTHGFSYEAYMLSEELIKCCSDCLSALFIPLFFIELYSKR